MLIEKRESTDVNQSEDNNELKIKELKKNELLKIGVAHKKIEKDNEINNQAIMRQIMRQIMRRIMR